MSSVPAAAERSLCLFEPPYDNLKPITPEAVVELRHVNDWKGRALVWQLTGSDRHAVEFEALRYKTPGLPLLVLLPPPHGVSHVARLLPSVRHLCPRLILPHGLIDSPYRLRHVMALPPRNIAASVTDFLIRRGVLTRKNAIREFQRILELAPQTRSIAGLCRRMYTSRRTLGRHFISTGIPVPSHCLHFGRLLHVAVHLQAENVAMFRIASRFGYPDGFTMSNQMKRLTGHRPTDVRELLGWEWLVEAWLETEGVTL
jgi:AraC-like DNA-binding protein